MVEAGFTPAEAIHIATANGAQFLGELDRIGTIAVGKQADLVVIKGDPSLKIDDIENVETVFKDGIGYDSAQLIESVRGVVGSRKPSPGQSTLGIPPTMPCSVRPTASWLRFELQSCAGSSSSPYNQIP